MMKLKALVAAIALIGAGAANAAAVLPGVSGSGGSLLFEAWNTATGTSFTQVLGANTADSVITGGVVGTSSVGADQVFSLDSSFAANLGSVSGLKWHVVSLKNVIDSVGNNAILQTANTTTAPTLNNNAVNSADANIQYTNINNLLGAGTTGLVLNNPSDPAYAGKATWGYNFGVTAMPSNAVTGFFTGAIDAATVYGPATGVGAFWMFTKNALSGTSQTTKSLFASDLGNTSWILQSDGTLTYHTAAAPAAVPLPAAAWLFGSGLLGLFGVARRRLNG